MPETDFNIPNLVVSDIVSGVVCYLQNYLAGDKSYMPLIQNIVTSVLARKLGPQFDDYGSSMILTKDGESLITIGIATAIINIVQKKKNKTTAFNVLNSMSSDALGSMLTLTFMSEDKKLI